MTETTTSRPAPRLKQVYREDIVAKLQEEFNYSNPMQVPGLTKVVVNMGVGDAARDSKLIEGAINDLTLITGQKPVVTRAKKSIAQFKLREGQPYRCTRDHAWRTDVGIRRPCHHSGSSAYPRLPRPLGSSVRRER